MARVSPSRPPPRRGLSPHAQLAAWRGWPLRRPPIAKSSASSCVPPVLIGLPRPSRPKRRASPLSRAPAAWAVSKARAATPPIHHHYHWRSRRSAPKVPHPPQTLVSLGIAPVLKPPHSPRGGNLEIARKPPDLLRLGKMGNLEPGYPRVGADNGRTHRQTGCACNRSAACRRTA